MSALAEQMDNLLAEIGLQPVEASEPQTQTAIEQIEAAAEAIAAMTGTPANDTGILDLEALLVQADHAAAEVLALQPAVEEQVIKPTIDEALRIAHDVIAAEPRNVEIVAEVIKALAEQKVDSEIFPAEGAEPSSEVIAYLVEATKLQLVGETARVTVIAAFAKAKDDLTEKPKARGRRKNAGSVEQAEAGDKPKRQKKEKPEPEYKPLQASRAITANLQLEERAKKVKLPDMILVESPSARGPKNRHQIDFSRPQGYAPTMPCLDRLAATGNPFPSDMNDPVVVPSNENWRPYVQISHAVYEALKAGPLFSNDDEKLTAIVKSVGMEWTNDSRLCAIDTMRDLWSCGLVVQETAGGRKRRFSLPTPAAE